MLVELLIGVMGIGSAAVLLIDPTGITMGIDYVLPYLPIPDFTLLGLWFLTVYGILPLYIVYATWKQNPLAWRLSVGLSLIEVLWILSQLFVFTEIGYFFLQPVILVQAVIILYLLSLREVKKYFSLS
jgi:uncharacterized membrane protein